MINFRVMQENDQEQVLKWRSSDRVSKYMLTEISHGICEQIEWFNRVDRSTVDEFWIIQNDDCPVGVLSLTQIDRINRHATWGMYLGESINSPEGGLIPIYFYNYVFSRADLNLNKIYGAVLDSNLSMLKMHKLCGYRLIGLYKEHKYHSGRYHDIHLVELLRRDWVNLGTRFREKVARFETRA
jgi:UDP-4-amino-4,6-dideoxy-N-acetyl-beta-L-altrosamine N-acetyltransferase